MNTKDSIKAVLLGMVFAPFRHLFKPKKDLWLFGSDVGRKYAQNSKYLFEYIRINHPEIKAYWITCSPGVYKELTEKGIPVLNNLTFKGAYYSHVAEMKIVSSWFNDILFTFPHQKLAYLMHGIAAKKVYYDNVLKKEVKHNLAYYFKSVLTDWFLYRYKLEYSCFSPVTSDFFKEKMVHAMRNENVYVTGQPRTDAFLHLNAHSIRAKYGIPEDKIVVSYMPTHRSYGLGDPPPHVFIDNKEAIRFFDEHNVLLVWKQHINMLKKYQQLEAPSCFKEMSFDYSVDPQELLFISDILITDWSSCFIDFMLLKKPILFYHYDDYEKEDNDVYFGADKLAKVGTISKSEDQLLSSIKSALDKDGVVMPDMSEWSFFNEYYDDKSSERCFSILIKSLNK